MTDAIASLCLSELAKPRQSVFGRGPSDTVAEIADLPKLDARDFFAETHITEGMGVLLRQVFDRLTARSDQGVFRLKQAVGGGKTHNLLAAALLAREPAERKDVLQRVGVAVDDRNIRVAAFSGRRPIPPNTCGLHCSALSAVSNDGSGRAKCLDPRPGQE